MSLVKVRLMYIIIGLVGDSGKIEELLQTKIPRETCGTRGAFVAS